MTLNTLLAISKISDHCSGYGGQMNTGSFEYIHSTGNVHLHMLGKSGSGKYYIMKKIKSILEKEQRCSIACHHGVPSFQMRGYTMREIFHIESTITNSVPTPQTGCHSGTLPISSTETPGSCYNTWKKPRNNAPKVSATAANTINQEKIYFYVRMISHEKNGWWSSLRKVSKIKTLRTSGELSQAGWDWSHYSIASLQRILQG